MGREGIEYGKERRRILHSNLKLLKERGISLGFGVWARMSPHCDVFWLLFVCFVDALLRHFEIYCNRFLGHQMKTITSAFLIYGGFYNNNLT